MKTSSKLTLFSALLGSTLAMGGCSDSDSSVPGDSSMTPDDGMMMPGEFIMDSGLPEGLSLNMLNASSGAFYSFDTTTGLLLDLNEVAASSQDPAVQNTQVTDTSVIGHFLVWPAAGHEHEDEEEEDGEEHEHEEEELEFRFLLMSPDYISRSPIDSTLFSVLFDFHGDELAGHLAEEYRNAEAGSTVAEDMENLNAFVVEQSELWDEVSEAMANTTETAGETLCRAYVDPYIAAEHGHEDEAGAEDGEEHAGEEEHEHEEVLVHYALTDTGRMYFFEEHEGELELFQTTFVKLDGTTSILDCDRTSISRVSEEGVLVFIPETQTLHLVDAHDGGRFHQHSVHDISDVLPAGVSADLIAIVGEGAEHDHDGDDEHDHESEGEDAGAGAGA